MSKIILNGIEYSNGITYEELQPVIYSDEEREVGVWRDGKPLYQRTFDLGSDITISNTSWYSSIVSVTNIENIILSFGLYSSGTYYPLMAYHTGDNVNVLACRANSGATVRYLTLQYTKTTDTAGSGTWTPSGVPSVHYSTNEQVIGTWIDGKPLYEKSFNLPSTITINNSSWTSTGVSISDIKNVVDGELNRNGLQKFACSLRAENSVIVIQTYFNGAQCNTDSVITVRYTKTTD